MENGIIIGVLGLIIGYFLYKFLSKKQRNSTSGYSDILTNDKFKVRGQWDR
jgi:hypothetical protein